MENQVFNDEENNNINDFISGYENINFINDVFSANGNQISTRIQELQALKSTLLTKENTFIAKYGSYKEIYEKINQWKNSGMSQFINGTPDFWNLLKEIQNSYGTNLKDLKTRFESTVHSAKFQNILNGELRENTDNVEAMKDILLAEINKEIDKNNKGIVSKDKKAKHINKQNSMLNLVLGIDKNGMKQMTNDDKQKGIRFKRQPKMEDGSMLTIRPSAAIRFMEIFDKDALNGLEYKGFSKDAIIKILLNSIASAPSEAKQWIEYYLNKDAVDKFDVYGSESSIKGFLGEVYWNSFFAYLSNGKIMSTPTGNVRTTQGKEIPVDLVFEDLGFQVKNYSMKNNTVSFGSMTKDTTGQGIDTFLRGRAQVDPVQAEQLIAFYSRLTIDPRWLTHSDFPEKVKGGLVREQNQPMKQYIGSYIPNIIGLSRQFSMGEKGKETHMINTLTGEQMDIRDNTFFLIQDNIIPGSYIVQAVIDMLMRAQSQLQFFDIDISYPQVEEMQDDQTFDSDNMMKFFPYETNGRPNAIKIKYKIDLSLDNFISNLNKVISQGG